MSNRGSQAPGAHGREQTSSSTAPFQQLAAHTQPCGNNPKKLLPELQELPLKPQGLPSPPLAVVGSGSCQVPPGTVPAGGSGVPAGGHLPLPSSPGTGRKGRCCCAGLYRFRMAWRFLLGSNPNSRNVFHPFRWSLQSARAHGEQQPRVLGPPLRGEGCTGGASPPLPRSPRPSWEAQLPSPGPKHPEKGNQRDTCVLGGRLGVFWDGSEGSGPVVPLPGSRDAALLVPAWKAQLFPGKLRPPRACIILREIPAWVWGVAAPMQPGVAPSAPARAARASLGSPAAPSTEARADRRTDSPAPPALGVLGCAETPRKANVVLRGLFNTRAEVPAGWCDNWDRS